MDFNLWREVSFPEEIALDKIVESGQCFRPKKISPSVYRFITKHSFLYCKQVSEKKLAFYVKEEEDWEKLWRPYFDIERNYREIEKKYPEDTFLRKSIAFGRGLRVLRQDPFEMLITFILSQRKSIPAIRSSVEKLCSAFGEKVYSAVEEEEISFRKRRLYSVGTFPIALSAIGFLLSRMPWKGLWKGVWIFPHCKRKRRSHYWRL